MGTGYEALIADVVYDACSHPNGWKPCWIFALGIFARDVTRAIP
jgi:hypothetical protein